jgi:serine/threonine-protein kinase
MSEREQQLDDLAAAVLDDAAIDWNAAEASVDGEDRSLVKDLRFVSTIAVWFRDGGPDASPDRLPDTDQEAPIENWGHLDILERVGRGAFGEVFRAWDTRLDREVALKLLPVSRSPMPQGASSIIEEGRLLAKVQHPNVVTIHGAEQIGERIGLWMEFVRGRTLEQLLRDGTRFTAADVAGIGLELCRAVSAVHAAGLVHRDIKAQNVIRTDSGRVVLMDFGTGKEFDDTSSSDLAGTPLYLAPEVLSGAPASVQSDIYSLGVVLYHLLTGSYPFTGRTIRELRAAHEHGSRVALRTSGPDVPRSLARAIERACDAQIEGRYATVDAFARDLDALRKSSRVQRMAYQGAVIAAVLMVALAGLEVRARIAGDRRGPVAWFGPLSGGSVNPVNNPVIAVLPFRNLSSEPGHDLLVDSVTSGLIGQLAIIDGLQVKSQHSSFMLRNATITDVGKRLGVNLAVEGDAQLAKNTLLVRVALVSVADDRQLWSGTVERHLKSEGDIVSVVEEVTRTLVNRLRLKLGRTQRRYETTDIATYEKYLRARALRDERGPAAHQAIALFREVLQADQSYAPALAALAATYGYLGFHYPGIGDLYIPPSEATTQAEPLALKAREIDPWLAEAHASLGFLYSFAKQWDRAEASFRHAIDLQPDLTSLYGDFVLSTLFPWGRLDEASSVLQDALAVDPLSLDVRRIMAYVQIAAGRYDEAIANCQFVIDRQPNFPFVRGFYARALLFKGQKTEATQRFRQLPFGNAEGMQGIIDAYSGRRAEAEAIAARWAAFPPRQIDIYGLLGDNDRVMDALERLAVLNPVRAANYLSQPELASLRGDPRVEVFRRKLGFPR